VKDSCRGYGAEELLERQLRSIKRLSEVDAGMARGRTFILIILRRNHLLPKIGCRLLRVRLGLLRAGYFALKGGGW
jgi:hypothetical protein